MANMKRIKELFNIDSPSVQECLRVIKREDAKFTPEFEFSQKWLIEMTGYSEPTIYSVVNILIDNNLVAVKSRTVRGKKPADGTRHNINISDETMYVLSKMNVNVYFFEAIVLIESDDKVEQRTFKVRATSLVEAALRIQELGHPDRNLLSLRLLPA